MDIKIVLSNARNEMETAEREFESASEDVKRWASRSINFYSPTALSDARHLISAAGEACNNLYTTCQSLVITIDDVCRPILNSADGLDIGDVSDIYKLIKKLNSNSDIEHKVDISIDDVDLGDASAKYSPTIQSKSIEKFWEVTYKSMPGYAEQVKTEAANEREAMYYDIEYAAGKENKQWFTASDVMYGQWLGNMSNQQISSKLTRLRIEGMAVRCEFGGKAYYRLLQLSKEYSKAEIEEITNRFIEEKQKEKQIEEEKIRKEKEEEERKKEIEHKNSILKQATAKMNTKDLSNYIAALQLLKSVRGWEDANEKIKVCEEKIAEIKAEQERLAKKKKTMGITAAIIVSIVLLAIIVLNELVIK